jgi:cardiolipin synthase A/B
VPLEVLAVSASSDLAALLSALAAALHVAICVVALGVIPGGRKPSTGMAWLILVLAAPFLGFLLFLLFGSTHVERRRQEKQLQANERIQARTAAIAELHEDTPRLTYVASVARLNRRLGSLPAVGGNSAHLYPGYADSITAMAEAVDRADTYVHAQFYITAWDASTAPFFEALVRATERDVPVRLLFDHLGSRGIPTYKETVERLKSTRIDWRPMMPIDPLHGRMRRPDLRNHRKILVVDGEVGFAGSQNLIEATYDKPKNQQAGRAWVELVVGLRGPVVGALDAVFLTDWYSETDQVPQPRAGTRVPVTAPVSVAGGLVTEPQPASVDDLICQVVPSGPGFVTENNLRMFNTLLYSAQERISITSPYFVPDESLLYAVTTAAQRGVEVELFVSEEGDQFMVYHAQRSYYEALLEAGVRIHLYPAPYVLHAKHFTIDDDVAVIGSSNMDMRSFALNYEISVMLLGPEIVARVREVEDTYRSLSRELTLQEWQGRSPGSRYVDNLMRLTAALQ